MTVQGSVKKQQPDGMSHRGGAGDALEGGEVHPRQGARLMASAALAALVTDSNGPQPLWQPPPTAYPTASGAAFEVPSLLTHPGVPYELIAGVQEVTAWRQPSAADCGWTAVFWSASNPRATHPPCGCDIRRGVWSSVARGRALFLRHVVLLRGLRIPRVTKAMDDGRGDRGADGRTDSGRLL